MSVPRARSDHRTARSMLSRLPESAALIVFLIAESIYFALRSQYFLSWDNWLNIFTAVAVIGSSPPPARCS